MNSTDGGKCRSVPDKFLQQLTIPFAKTETVVCTHSAGEGSHSWSNAFYAIDLATPYDSPAATIFAAENGKAFVFQGKDGSPCLEPKGTAKFAELDTCGNSWGNNIKILHSDGFFSFYVHLEKVLVKTGDTVKKGQPIGIEGWTGAAGHRHLHFSVQKLPGNNQQEWESKISWDGMSVPFSFDAIQNGAPISVSSDKITCPHENIGQVPGDHQPTYRGVF
jgi:murein DD-endopeptidase MepM/ murein hydrolase activator NlpD